MPTNVTAEYAKAEREYQQAKTTPQKLIALKRMLVAVPRHKGTERLQKEIKERIRKLKYKQEKEIQAKKTGFSLAVKKEGAAQVVLVGPANTGKTALLNELCGSSYGVGDYLYTTTKPQLGTLDYETVKIQMVDLPPLVSGATLKQAAYFAIIRNADLVLIVVERLEEVEGLLGEFEDSHIILNREKPRIVIKREGTGGLTFIGERLIEGSLDEVKKVLREHNIANGTVEIFSKVKLDDFFEVLDERLVYLPALVVLNKQDRGGKISRQGDFEVIPVSVLKKINLELLKEKIWEKLGLIKVYTKEPGKKASLKEPITLKKGSSIKDMATHVHKDFIKKFKYARVWGDSAKHAGQKIGLEHKLKDDDVVEVHLK